jgi:hypothetical protein
MMAYDVIAEIFSGFPISHHPSSSCHKTFTDHNISFRELKYVPILDVCSIEASVTPNALACLFNLTLLAHHL